MNKGTGTYIAIIVIGVLAVVVFFLFDFGASKTYASPEEVIEGIRIAAQKDDVRSWCQCMTESSRDLIAADFAAREMMRKRGPNNEQKEVDRAVAKVFDQHGLTEEYRESIQDEVAALLSGRAPFQEQIKIAKRILAPVRDRDGFIADMYKTIQQGTRAEGLLALWKNAKLVDVEVKGQMAVGTVSLKGQDEQFFFKKESGSWRLDLIGMAESKQMRLPAGHP